MKLEIEIDENGFLIPQKTSLKKGVYIVDAKNQDLRTLAQNNAMHLYFTMLANELNKSGYSLTKVMREPQLYTAEIEWSLESVKSYIWKPIQEALYKKKSTTSLSKSDITRIYENANIYTSERMGIGLPFPNYETKEK